MSDIMIHICSSDDTSQGPHPAGKAKKKKRKPFHKKMQYLQGKGYLKGKQNNNFLKKQDQTPHQSRTHAEHPPPPTATQNKSLPHLSAGASHSDSRPSMSVFNLKPLLNRAKNKGSLENPKGSANTKTTAVDSRPSVSGSHRPTATPARNPTKYLAIDCEMVGAGPKGSINQLARCSIVSYDGDIVFDKFIKPVMPITDYRTRWSGIRPRDLITATPYAEARKEILRLLMGKVVIGHAIHNDFKALSYTHPHGLTRDTSRIPLLNLKAGFAEKECASLKRLTKAIFNRDIQVGKKGHSSVEDARATMELYKVVEEEWESTLLSKSMAN